MTHNAPLWMKCMFQVCFAVYFAFTIFPCFGMDERGAYSSVLDGCCLPDAVPTSEVFALRCQLLWAVRIMTHTDLPAEQLVVFYNFLVTKWAVVSSDQQQNCLNWPSWFCLVQAGSTSTNRAARKSMAVIVSGRMTVTKLRGARTCCFGTAGSGRHVHENLLLSACWPLSLNFIDCSLFEWIVGKCSNHEAWSFPRNLMILGAQH